ncbi:MAG: hypothetical protein Q7T25_08930 [Sideroxyarcus sp.]|nr:hypothetical protein [Sideroxyarcus sp.]
MGHREFGGYSQANLLVPTVDFAVPMPLAHVVHFLVVATTGFLTGAAVINILSTRQVFARRRWADREGAEVVLFTLSGVAGLVLNNEVIYALDQEIDRSVRGSKLILSRSITSGRFCTWV